MKRGIVALLFVSLTLFSRLAGATDANADKYQELLRSDLRTQKVALITKALDLTKSDSDKFWPIYREYDQKLAKINDARIANIKAYAENYDAMTNDNAAGLVKTALKNNRDRFDLQKKYYEKFAKAVSTVIAARFLQVEQVVNSLLDLQIGLELPLIPKLEAVPAKQQDDSPKK